MSLYEQQLQACRAQPSAYLQTKRKKLTGQIVAESSAPGSEKWSMCQAIDAILAERETKAAAWRTRQRRERRNYHFSRKSADRVDGYDRDDIGESQD